MRHLSRCTQSLVGPRASGTASGASGQPPAGIGQLPVIPIFAGIPLLAEPCAGTTLLQFEQCPGSILHFVKLCSGSILLLVVLCSGNTLLLVRLCPGTPWRLVPTVGGMDLLCSFSSCCSCCLVGNSPSSPQVLASEPAASVNLRIVMRGATAWASPSHWSRLIDRHGRSV